MILKSNYFVSICHIISKQIGRKVFPFMTAKEVMDIKNNINVYQFPIKQHYNQERRKNEKENSKKDYKKIIKN
jgi:hypothetical protein